MLYKRFHFYHAIPNQWKRIIKTTNDSCINIVYLSLRLVTNNRIVALEKLPSKEIYSLIISLNMSTLILQQYFKTLNNVLYLDHKLFQFKVRTTSLCWYWNQHDETVQHVHCTTVQRSYFILGRNQTSFCKRY